eukprot:7722053-Lingulodinium_polyedra.AAC.1
MSALALPMGLAAQHAAQELGQLHIELPEAGPGEGKSGEPAEQGALHKGNEVKPFGSAKELAMPDASARLHPSPLVAGNAQQSPLLGPVRSAGGGPNTWHTSAPCPRASECR